MNNEKHYLAALQNIIKNSRSDSAAYIIAVRALNPAPAVVVTIYSDGSGHLTSENNLSGHFSDLNEGIAVVKKALESAHSID